MQPGQATSEFIVSAACLSSAWAHDAQAAEGAPYCIQVALQPLWGRDQRFGVAAAARNGNMPGCLEGGIF